jgi:hypothetical protein
LRLFYAASKAAAQGYRKIGGNEVTSRLRFSAPQYLSIFSIKPWLYSTSPQQLGIFTAFLTFTLYFWMFPSSTTKPALRRTYFGNPPKLPNKLPVSAALFLDHFYFSGNS